MASQQDMEEDVVVRGKTKRILAFDLIRGFFLIVILIDHVQLYPNGWDIFTGRGTLWVSAAEGFFFLSGLLIGMIYKRRLHLGMKFIIKKMWKRAAQLYVVGTSLTFLYLCWVEFTHHAPIKDTLPSPLPWHHIIEQALVMRFTYGWADFLVRFALLMLIAPLVFYLVAKGRWKLAVAGIFIAWLFRGNGFTLSWQLIFNSGIIIGFYWNTIRGWFATLKARRRRQIKLSVGALAGATFLLSYASVFLLTLLYFLWGRGDLGPSWQHVAWTWSRLNHDVWNVADKWTMGPVRVVLFFLWFATTYWVVRRYEAAIARYTLGVLELLGRNSLFVYTAQSLIIFIFKMYIIPPKTNFWQNFAITSVALVLLIAVTKYYKIIEPGLAKIKLSNARLPLPGSKG